MISPALRQAKSLWSYNPIPYGCVLNLELWHPAMSGPIFKSIDSFGHICTVTGNPTWSGDGWLLDGAGDRLIVANHSSFAFTTEAFTIEMLLKATDLTANISPFGKGDGTDGYWSAIRTDGAIWMSTNDADAAEESKSSAAEIVINTWYHLVIIKNGAAVSMIKDGTGLSLDTSATHTNIGANSGNLSIGDLFGGSGQDYKGYMKVFRIYNRAWSAVEAAYANQQTRWLR